MVSQRASPESNSEHPCTPTQSQTCIQPSLSCHAIVSKPQVQHIIPLLQLKFGGNGEFAQVCLWASEAEALTTLPTCAYVSGFFLYNFSWTPMSPMHVTPRADGRQAHPHLDTSLGFTKGFRPCRPNRAISSRYS